MRFRSRWRAPSPPGPRSHRPARPPRRLLRLRSLRRRNRRRTTTIVGKARPRPRVERRFDCRRATPSAAGAATPVTPTEKTPAVNQRTGDPNAIGRRGASGAGATSDPTSEETRTNDAIAAVIRQNRQPFRDCYDRAAAKDANLPAGTLTLHFVLDPTGKVKLAELNAERSTVKSPDVVNCAVAVLKQLKFPASSRGMESTANYPFDFKR
ncbi:MAG: AgmX/PglI C-terminal domain-containing protein [Polyangiaceae bacterium]